jgi:hypothetical protein
VELTHEWKLDTDLSGARWAETDFRDFVAARSAVLFRGALVLTGNREAAEDLVLPQPVRCRDRGRPGDLAGHRAVPARPGHRQAQTPVPIALRAFTTAAHGRIQMTSNDARPSGCTGYTPFEKELVNAMRDFANSTDSPDFAPDIWAGPLA